MNAPTRTNYDNPNDAARRQPCNPEMNNFNAIGGTKRDNFAPGIDSWNLTGGNRLRPHKRRIGG